MICTTPNVVMLDYDHLSPTGKPSVKFTGGKQWLKMYDFEYIEFLNIFKASVGENKKYMRVPCGQCRFCRINRAYQWSNRLMLEMLNYKRQGKDINCWFLTLTYRPEDIPIIEEYEYCGNTYKTPKNKWVDRYGEHEELQGHLEPRDLELFWKRLRKNLKLTDFKYFACGEYGPTRSKRPHYHAIVMGLPIHDLKAITGKQDLYHSNYIEETWKKGYVSIRPVTIESCNYVTGYILKKQNGSEAYLDSYVKTGKYIKEFQRQSMGLGKEFYVRNRDSIFVVENGKVIHDEISSEEARIIIKKIPYYDKLYGDEEPENMAIIKQHRAECAINAEKNMMKGTNNKIAEQLQIIQNDQIEKMTKSLLAKQIKKQKERAREFGTTQKYQV